MITDLGNVNSTLLLRLQIFNSLSWPSDIKSWVGLSNINL